MSELQLDEYFTRSEDMREAALQKRNSLMHHQLKSFETSLQQASDYYNPDDLYRLVAPIIPPGVQILSFDALQRIVAQSKKSKGGRIVKSKPSLYLRAFLQDFLQYLDHLQQLKDNFNERIYAVLFEFYFEIVFQNFRTNSQTKQGVQPSNLPNVLDSPECAKFREQSSKEFVEEVAADCEKLSEIMTNLQMLVRRWGQIWEDEDIDISLFDTESEVGSDTYPNCDNFEAIIRFVPDVLCKGKIAHKLAYDWWCLAEKIRKKLTRHWKPKGASPKKFLQVKTVHAARSNSPSDVSRDTTPTTKVTSRASTYHEHCAPTKKNNAWVNPSPNPTKVKKKNPSSSQNTRKLRQQISGIPRRVVKPQKEKRTGKKTSHWMTQTQKRVRDACTSPQIATEDLMAKNDSLPKHGKPDFDEDERGSKKTVDAASSSMPRRGSKFSLMHREERAQVLDERIELLTFDIDSKVKQLEERIQELAGESPLRSRPQRISNQVERAIADIESLQNGLQEIEVEKNRLKWNLRDSRRGAITEEDLKRDVEALNEKMRQMAGLAKVNTYRHQLLSSDMQLALELRGTFTRYNQEVKGKIQLLERLIDEERREQAKLEEEIANMRASIPKLEGSALYIQSITPAATTPDSGRVNTSKESLLQRGDTYDENDADGYADLDWDDKTPDISEDEIDDYLINHTDLGGQVPADDNNKMATDKSGNSKKAEDQVADDRMATNKRVVGMTQNQNQVAREDATLSPLEEESGLQDSATSLVGFGGSRRRPDSPSPIMFESKREIPIELDLDPNLKLPKIGKKASKIQQV